MKGRSDAIAAAAGLAAKPLAETSDADFAFSLRNKPWVRSRCALWSRVDRRQWDR